MIRSLVFVVIFVMLSSAAAAEGYSYQARIEGMVCAFCAYNVGRTIGTLTGVDTESVTVDLDTNVAEFHARSRVEWADVSAAFSDSGFVLVQLDQVDSPTTESTSVMGPPHFTLEFDAEDAERFERIFEAIGEVASAQSLHLVIEAREAVEVDLLMPILMGRKNAISIRFVPIDEASIRLKVYSAIETSSH